MTALACRCGAVRLEVVGEPILSVECLCTSCRTAAAELEARPGAPRILTATGGTPFVLCRADRVRFADGAVEHLRAHRLHTDATTRRVIASCCDTPVFLQIDHGHWLSLYAGLWPPDERPPITLRTMARDLDDPGTLPHDVPNARTHTAGFVARLLGAWVGMGFRAPRIADGGPLGARTA